MKHLFRHLLLILLMIFHFSSGSVMAYQMQTSNKMMMGSPDLSNSQNTLVNIDSSTENPCPHHAMTMSSESSSDSATMLHINCGGHDCSNCNCVNVLSTLIFEAGSFDQLPVVNSLKSAFIISAFPDSPPTFVLRPPIS